MVLTQKAAVGGQIQEKHVVIGAMLVAIVAYLMVQGAIAGTDATFNAPLTTLQGWISGSYGKLVSVGALAVGLAVSIVKQSLMFVAAGAGIAITASAAPAVLTGMLAATL